MAYQTESDDEKMKNLAKRVVTYEDAEKWALSNDSTLKRYGELLIEQMNDQDTLQLELDMTSSIALKRAEQEFAIAEEARQLAAAADSTKRDKDDWAGIGLKAVTSNAGNVAKGVFNLGAAGAVLNAGIGGINDVGKGLFTNKKSLIGDFSKALFSSTGKKETAKVLGKGIAKSLGRGFFGGALAGGVINTAGSAFAASPVGLTVGSLLNSTEAGRGSALTDNPIWRANANNKRLEDLWTNSNQINWDDYELNSEGNGLATYVDKDNNTYLRSRDGKTETPLNYIGKSQATLPGDAEYYPTTYYKLGDENVYFKLDPNSTSYRVNTSFANKNKKGGKMNYFKEGGRFIPKALNSWNSNRGGLSYGVGTDPLNPTKVIVTPSSTATSASASTPSSTSSPYAAIRNIMFDTNGQILYNNFDTRGEVDRLENQLAYSGGPEMSFRDQRAFRRYGKWGNEALKFLTNANLGSGMTDEAFLKLSPSLQRRWLKISRKMDKYGLRIYDFGNSVRGTRYGLNNEVIREGENGYDLASLVKFTPELLAQREKENAEKEAGRKAWAANTYMNDIKGEKFAIDTSDHLALIDKLALIGEIEDDNLVSRARSLGKAGSWGSNSEALYKLVIDNLLAKGDESSYKTALGLQEWYNSDNNGIGLYGSTKKSHGNLVGAEARKALFNKLATAEGSTLLTDLNEGAYSMDNYIKHLKELEKASKTLLNLDTYTTGMTFKKGGNLNNKNMNKYQQGGAAPQQDMQALVAQLVQAAMAGDEKATQTINQIMEAAKQGDQLAMQIAQLIQQIAQQMQGQLAQAAKRGAKLSYLHELSTGCPAGTEPHYYKKGGHICKACVEKAKKAACGTKAQVDKCGGKAKKHENGGVLEALRALFTARG